MARPLRLEFPGAVYHLTSRGNDRQKIFLRDADRDLFLEILGHVVSRYGWICHAHCLMPNHYHLLVQTFNRRYQSRSGASCEGRPIWYQVAIQLI